MMPREPIDAARADEPCPLSSDEIDDILSKDNGPFVLLELVRRGRIDAETAATAIERADRTPFLERLAVAIIDTLFSPFSR